MPALANTERQGVAGNSALQWERNATAAIGQGKMCDGRTQQQQSRSVRSLVVGNGGIWHAEG